MTRKAPDIGGLFSAQRIVVTGANGAGKTHFATRISQETGVPVTHMDALKLTTGWQTRDPDIVQRDLIARAAAPRWIIEGGPSCLVPDVLDRADLIIWLRPRHSLRLWRILWRSLRERGQTRAELPDGNPESFDRRALRFAWRSWRNSAQFDAQIAQRLAAYDPVVLRSGTQTR